MTTTDRRRQGRRVDAEWSARPVAAFTIRALAFALPAVTAAALTWALAARWPRPDGPSQVVWWAGMLLAGTATFVAIERVARRLLPLAALLQLSLAFPDRTPSRYRLALLAGTTTSLREVVDRASAGDLGATPADAAETVLLLTAALNRHDRLTRGHSERVRAYAEILGAEMGMDEAALGRLRWSALLHDVGKLCVPTEVLNKPGRLTEEEYRVIQQHPLEGERLVAPLADWLGDEGTAIAQHHERFDGNGYPRGLVGHEISLAARVVSVADTFDVITSARSYKRPMTAAAARAEIARCSGTQFDPAVTKALLGISVGRLWRAGGPLTWAMSLPGLANAPMVGGSLGSLGGAASALGVAAVVAVGSTTIAAAAEGPILPLGKETAAVLGSTQEPGSTADATSADDDAGPGRRDEHGDDDRTGRTDAAGEGSGASAAAEATTNADGSTGTGTTAATSTPPGGVGAPTSSDRQGSASDGSPAGSSPRSGLGGVIGGVGDTVDDVVEAVPPIQVPTVSVPPIQVPTITVPLAGTPPISVPPITVPQVSIPPVTLPSVGGLLGGR